MERLDLARFCELVGGTFDGTPRPDIAIQEVAIHSERLPQGAAFFALNGQHADGHKFVAHALENGAAAAVVRSTYQPPPGLETGRLVRVDDPLRALQQLAGWWRGKLQGTVIAVVGGNGKTTTKDAFVQFGSSLGFVYGSPGSYNSQLGAALSILRCPVDADVIAIEAAGAEQGGMEFLRKLIQPNHVIATNLGTRWAGNFPDTATRARSTASVAADLNDGSWVLLGTDEPELVRAFRSHSAAVMICNQSERLPKFQRRGQGPKGFWLDLAFPDEGNAGLSLPSLSAEIIDDIELAVSAVYLLGGSLADVIASGGDFRPSSTRTEIWRSPRGVTLVRDIATSDPIALRSAIQTAKRVAGDGARVSIVLGAPDDAWTTASALAIAEVIEAEEIRTVDAIDAPASRSIEEYFGRRHDTIVRLFASAEELRDNLLEQTDSGDVLLVQAPRDLGLPDLSQTFVEAMAPNRMYVDLCALEENVGEFRRIVGPRVEVLAMVKALAYGTDLVGIASALQDVGIDRLGVSSIDEGAALRRHGIHKPMLVFMPVPTEVERAYQHHLTPVVYSPEMAAAVSEYAHPSRPVTVHLEIETGMHRTGLSIDEAVMFLEVNRDKPWLRVTGLMTHFAAASDAEHDAATKAQIVLFDSVIARANALGYSDIVKHAAATSGTLRFPEAHYDMVRIGIGLYGVPATDAPVLDVNLRPVLSFRSRIVEIATVAPGETVGYGKTFEIRSAAGGRVGVVPAGYNDGVPRAFSNRGYVMVDGVNCLIVGAVSMDSMTIDLSNCPTARVGSDVLIYGQLGSDSVPIEEAAKAIGTIPYELMTQVGDRVQRLLTRH